MPHPHEDTRRFDVRRLVALILLGSGALVSITGAVLFFAPVWKTASLLQWKFLWLSKGQHSDLHMVSCGVFLVAGLVHIAMHLRTLLQYLHQRIRPLLLPSFELLAAVALILFLTWGTVANRQPFMAFLDFAENFRNSYVLPE
jgi:hypothetical protein